MKILLINQTFYPDVAATAQYLTDLAVELAKTGHEVHVLTAQKSYGNENISYSAHEKHAGIQITRVWSPGFNKKIKLSRFLDAIILNLAFAWKLLWMDPVDCIVALTSPPLVARVGLAFAKWEKARFVYWVMDLNPHQAVRAGWIKEKSFSARVLKNSIRKILKECDQVIALDSFMKALLIEEGASSKAVKIIPPWAWMKSLKTIDRGENTFRKAYGLTEPFIVMYSGNLSLCHPLTTLLEAARYLREDAGVRFIFIGEGDGVCEVKKYKDQYHLNNVLLMNYRDRDELSHSLSAADLHVVSMGETFVGIVHPSKIYNILAVGKPFVLIGPEKSAIGEIIQTHKVGYQVGHGDVEKLISIIGEVRSLSDEMKSKIAEKSKEICRKYFSEEKLLKELISTITDV